MQFLEDLLLSTILFFFAGKEMIVVQMTEIVHIVQSIYWVQMNVLAYNVQCKGSPREEYKSIDISIFSLVLRL